MTVKIKKKPQGAPAPEKVMLVLDAELLQLIFNGALDIIDLILTKCPAGKGIAAIKCMERVKTAALRLLELKKMKLKPAPGCLMDMKPVNTMEANMKGVAAKGAGTTAKRKSVDEAKKDLDDAEAAYEKAKREDKSAVAIARARQNRDKAMDDLQNAERDAPKGGRCVRCGMPGLKGGICHNRVIFDDAGNVVGQIPLRGKGGGECGGIIR